MFKKAHVIGVFAILGVLVGLGVMVAILLPNQPPIMQLQDASVGYAESFGSMGAPGMAAYESMLQKSRGIVPPNMGGYGSVAVDVPQENRLIIKTGGLSLLVSDVPKGIARVETYAIANKGFVVSSNIEKLNLGFTGWVTIRVPAESFEAAMSALRSYGEVQSQNVTGQDVTEEFVDIQAQIRNLKASEDQFLAIMRQAVKIEDILAVQRELTNVRAQIENLEGRKKYLTQSAAMSSITVHLATDPSELPVLDEKEKWKPLAEIKESIRALLGVGKGFGNLIIRLVIFIPLWAGLGFLGWLAYRLGRRLWHRFVE